MIKRIASTKAGSILEYIMVLMVVIAALMLMQKYIVRAFAGRWQSTGDSFGYGRQYDPAKTKERAWSAREKIWYDKPCYDACYENSKSRLAACKKEKLCSSRAYDESCRRWCQHGIPSVLCTENCFPKCLEKYRAHSEACQAAIEKDCALQCKEQAGDQV